MQSTWLHDGTDTCSLHGFMMAQTQMQSTWLHDGTYTDAVYMAP
jgi:hypothetical protein